LSITSQNSSSFTTLCKLLHPSSAKGKIVGLFMPGSSAHYGIEVGVGRIEQDVFVLRCGLHRLDAEQQTVQQFLLCALSVGLAIITA
jgi:hypothetical protein